MFPVSVFELFESAYTLYPVPPSINFKLPIFPLLSIIASTIAGDLCPPEALTITSGGLS